MLDARLIRTLKGDAENETGHRLTTVAGNVRLTIGYC
jgi:hypothetical protein